LCERKFKTFFINSDTEIKSLNEIHHFNYPLKSKEVTYSFIPEKTPLLVVLTSGASCPDTLVDRVMLKFLEFFPETKSVEEVMENFER